MKSTGDDALAAVVAWGVHHFLRSRRLDVLSDWPLVLGEGIQARYLTRGRVSSRVERCIRILRSDLHVIGGGTVLHDYRTTVRSLRALARYQKVVSWTGGKTAAFGVTLGPLHTAEGRKLLAHILHEMDAVVVRDQPSLELVRALDGAAASRVRLCPDPAILVNRVDLPEPRSLHRVGSPVVLLAPLNYHRLTGRDSEQDEIRRRRLGECLRKISRESPASFRLLAMSGRQGDESLCREIARYLPEDRVEILGYDPNPLFAYRAIEGSDLVLGMRLHSLVFAYAASVPFVAMDYHMKVPGFVRLVGADESRMVNAHDFDPLPLADIILEMLQAPPASLRPLLPVGKAQRQVLEAFGMLAATMGAPPEGAEGVRAHAPQG